VLDGDAEVTVAGDAREFAGWRRWTFEEVLAADRATLAPHLQRFTAKLIDVLATLAGAGPPELQACGDTPSASSRPLRYVTGLGKYIQGR
jgi:hypothetical protein